MNTATTITDLPEFSYLLAEPTDRGVVDIPRVLGAHVVDERVHLARQLPHDGQRGHVQSHTGTLLQFRLVNLEGDRREREGERERPIKHYEDILVYNHNYICMT